MKILHTSDWHIGKRLNEHSRLGEQRQFLNDFVCMVKKNKIDIVVIAGDIYDVTTPSIEAEELFFNSMERISRNGETLVIVSAGNHDSADRLSASKVWGAKLGVVIVGTINDEVIDTTIKKFTIKNIENGVFSVIKNSESKEEKAVFLNLAYPSETRINYKIEESSEKTYEQLYKEHLQKLINDKSKYFENESYNIVIGHFLMFGGSVSESEREINIGGLDSINSEILPVTADYIALGHLHKKQKISGHKNCYYAGSPLQYSRAEKSSKKYVLLIDTNNKNGEPEAIELKTYKPIEILKNQDIDTIIDYIKSQVQESWYYIEIEQSSIEVSKIQELRSISNSIVEIIPIRTDNSSIKKYLSGNMEEKTVKENFIDYYKFANNEEPDNGLINIFLDIVESVNE